MKSRPKPKSGRSKDRLTANRPKDEDAVRSRGRTEASSTESHVSIVELATRELRRIATEAAEHGFLMQVDSAILTSMADALDGSLRSLLAARPDESTPSGVYLAHLADVLGDPETMPTPDAVRWHVTMLDRGRRLLLRALGPLEIVADADLILDLQVWVRELDAGPPKQ